MTTAIFHPNMLERLVDFFPGLCTIQTRVQTQDAVTGEITITWVNLAGHVDLPCSHGPSKGDEVKRADQTYVVSNYTLALRGNYPTINETMQAVVAGTAYEILLVQWDSHDMKTRILTRKVT
jgi:hypothetical protein